MSENSANSPETDSQAPWGGVTDPTQHDPKHFRYLIHLDSGKPTYLGSEIETADKVWEYMLDDPAKIRSLSSISASLVDQDHPILYQGTGSSHGFIIEAPRPAIIAAHSRDMSSRSKSEDVLNKDFPVPDPNQLMADTKPTDWNEVVVSPDGTVVKAIFWVDGQTDDDTPFKREEVRKMAEEHGLPFLELELVKY